MRARVVTPADAGMDMNRVPADCALLLLMADVLQGVCWLVVGTT
jgi:hypothetical protein